ncbi:MAG: 50S ribosomal protein L9 [Acidobacteria bacterium]|nr:50S ribosomal protein L9 [Acidobacteriota bacterium]
MQVILIDDVFHLGRRGEVVRVAEGYGRNYLIPKKLAIPVTPGNLKMIEQQQLAFARKEAKFRGEAELLANELNQLHVILSRKAGETGVLFGSVTSKDLTDLLEQNGIHLDRRRILLQQPVKTIGNHRISVLLHSDVKAELLLSVVVEGDETITKVKKKDEESERIIAELDSKLRDIEQLSARPSLQVQPEVEKQPAKKGRVAASARSGEKAAESERKARKATPSEELKPSKKESKRPSKKKKEAE